MSSNNMSNPTTASAGAVVGPAEVDPGEDQVPAPARFRDAEDAFFAAGATPTTVTGLGVLLGLDLGATAGAEPDGWDLRAAETVGLDELDALFD